MGSDRQATHKSTGRSADSPKPTTSLARVRLGAPSQVRAVRCLRAAAPGRARESGPSFRGGKGAGRQAGGLHLGQTQEPLELNKAATGSCWQCPLEAAGTDRRARSHCAGVSP